MEAIYLTERSRDNGCNPPKGGQNLDLNLAAGIPVLKTVQGKPVLALGLKFLPTSFTVSASPLLVKS